LHAGAANALIVEAGIGVEIGLNKQPVEATPRSDESEPLEASDRV
jgi:hypothetical protein